MSSVRPNEEKYPGPSRSVIERWGDLNCSSMKSSLACTHNSVCPAHFSFSLYDLPMHIHPVGPRVHSSLCTTSALLTPRSSLQPSVKSSLEYIFRRDHRHGPASGAQKNAGHMFQGNLVSWVALNEGFDAERE